MSMPHFQKSRFVKRQASFFNISSLCLSDVNVRVSVLTLYGALVTTRAPLPEIQLLLRQPESAGAGSFTPQDSVLSWRQRDGEATPPTPVNPPQRGSQAHSPHALRTPEELDSAPPWLLQLCMSLVTQPRDDQSDGEGAGAAGGSAALEPSPVRLEALQVTRRDAERRNTAPNTGGLSFLIRVSCVFQVMSYLVRGYFSLAQACLSEIGQVSARCLGETEPSVQLHGAKVTPSGFSYSTCK